MKNYDLVIIGGGAAGMMSAISARRHHTDFSIAIIDRTFALGRKILIAGAGRCNITNVNLNDSIDEHYYTSDINVVESVFKDFNYEKIVEFFNDLGIELYTERKTSIGKVFPTTNQARTVTDLLLDEIERNNIDIFYNTDCKDIKINDRGFELLTEEYKKENGSKSQQKFNSKYLILSAGGKTYPSFGSNGSGFELASILGHSIVEPVPSALSLEGKNFLSQLLQGQKHEIEATSIINGKEIKTRTDDVMFKKYGLSGPAILNISREISIALNRGKDNFCEIKLNFFPGRTANEVRSIMESRWRKRPDQTLEKSLYGLFPNKIANALVQFSNLDPQIKVKDLNESDTSSLLIGLSNTKITITATRSWNEAEFTAGGIDVTEVKENTLESKIVKNLYFAGEVLDVDGDVGGFNLSWSWASGFVAGKLS